MAKTAAMSAAILGLDTAAGAYLARLLGARGYAVRGTGGAALLAKLGVADDVMRDDDVGVVIDGAAEIYDLRGDPAASTDLLARGAAGRVLVAVEPGAAPLAATGFVATAQLFPHESRFGPGTSPVARIVAAAAAGVDPDPADLATATDCGWTAEYVDAMWRLLQRPTPATVTIATGRLLAGNDVARVACAYFERPAPPLVAVSPGIAGNPASANALGWRAITWGDDLVTVLCEGAAG